jgi:hypothetical protein
MSKCDDDYSILGNRKEISVYEREIWNAAIEQAARVVDQANRDGPYQAIASAKEIRKLKV